LFALFVSHSRIHIAAYPTWIDYAADLGLQQKIFLIPRCRHLKMSKPSYAELIAFSFDKLKLIILLY